MKEYDYFWCPGCSTYRHKDRENIVRVSNMTKRIKRQDNTKNFYTVAWSFLCDFCIEKAKYDGKEKNEKGSDADLP